MYYFNLVKLVIELYAISCFTHLELRLGGGECGLLRPDHLGDDVVLEDGARPAAQAERRCRRLLDELGVKRGVVHVHLDALDDHRVDVVLVVLLQALQEGRVRHHLLRRLPEVVHHLACEPSRNHDS
eukprot:676474-Prorocentrum_minimum.AAC.8